jgi:hypothetical protein
MADSYIDKTESRRAFMDSKYFSTKHAHYFKIYDEVVRKIKNRSSRNLVIVEIGILHGGSLFMWRELFGPDARIIGIDLNPEAIKWESYGFEIFIGSQSSPEFWSKFYEKVGPIDLLIDDGGHTNRQQIITTVNALNNMKPGGFILIEDTNTSFLREFGNPSKSSFVNFSKRMIDLLYVKDRLNAEGRKIRSNVERITFIYSIVLFEVKEGISSGYEQIDNGGVRDSASDFRHEDFGKVARHLSLVNQSSMRRASLCSRNTIVQLTAKATFQAISELSALAFKIYLSIGIKKDNYQIRRYWRV